jgi:phosphoinositide-3-kinase regulatory subunit 4
MRSLANDPDVAVRTTFATGLVKLADAAVSMLELSQASKSTLEATPGVTEVSWIWSVELMSAGL